MTQPRGRRSTMTGPQGPHTQWRMRHKHDRRALLSRGAQQHQRRSPPPREHTSDLSLYIYICCTSPLSLVLSKGKRRPSRIGSGPESRPQTPIRSEQLHSYVYIHSPRDLGPRLLSRPFVTPLLQTSARYMSCCELDIWTCCSNRYNPCVFFVHHPS